MEKEEKEENFRRVERQYGSFTRSFTLPSSVDPGQVIADYEKGVLKIKLAKKAEAKPKQIKVNVAARGPSKPRLKARPHKNGLAVGWRMVSERNGGRLILLPFVCHFEREKP